MLCNILGSKRRILMITLLSVLLVSALAGASLVNLAAANFESPPQYVIRFISPENRTYATKNVPLTVEISGSRLSFFGVYQVLVFLDGASLRMGKTTPSYTNPYSVNLNLPNLSEGEHYLEVWWVSDHPFHRGDAGGRSFSIDTVSPLVSVVSPQNKTYDTSVIALNLTLSEPVPWVGYSLDGKANTTITEAVAPTTYSYGSVDDVRFAVSTVLTGLSSGVHNLTIYAEDEAGNVGKSASVTFKVETQVQPQSTQPTERQSEELPTTWTATAIVASVAVVSFGLVAYFVRRNRRKSK